MNSYQELNESDANLVSGKNLEIEQSAETGPMVVPSIPEEESDTKPMVVPSTPEEESDTVPMVVPSTPEGESDTKPMVVPSTPEKESDTKPMVVPSTPEEESDTKPMLVPLTSEEESKTVPMVVPSTPKEESNTEPTIVSPALEKESDMVPMSVFRGSENGQSNIQVSKESLEAEVLKIKNELKGLARKTLICAFKLGEILTILKKEAGHGQWEGYLKSVLRICPRSARNYITIYDGLKVIPNILLLLKSESMADLGVTKALEYIREKKKEGRLVTEEDLLKFEPKEKSKPEPKRNDSIALADGKKLSMKKLGWNDGLIRWDELIKSRLLVGGPAGDAELSARAQVQQMALVLIAGLNRGCGSAPKDAVAEVFKSAVEEVRSLLVEQNDRAEEEERP